MIYGCCLSLLVSESHPCCTDACVSGIVAKIWGFYRSCFLAARVKVPQLNAEAAAISNMTTTTALINEFAKFLAHVYLGPHVGPSGQC
jgi:hypothetical protein